MYNSKNNNNEKKNILNKYITKCVKLYYNFILVFKYKRLYFMVIWNAVIQSV